MADVTINGPQRLSGEVSAPPSKAYTHRMLVAGLLSEGVSKISNPLVSDDTQATLNAVEAFGARVDLKKNCWTVKGTGTLVTPRTPIDCRESGTTLRFMIPVAAFAHDPSIFYLGASLKRRPITPLLQSLKELGAESKFQENNEDSSIQIQGGGIKGGKATIRGDISSQFISGLLFACPKAKEDTEITLTTPLESRSYVEMTKEIVNKH
jgi:3-phosphoshikimate 1-carboxyvinyltransferase